MKLTRYVINPDLCRRCGACLSVCPRQATQQLPDHRIVIDQERCDRCGICADVCKLRAITRQKGLFK